MIKKKKKINLKQKKTKKLNKKLNLKMNWILLRIWIQKMKIIKKKKNII